MRRSPGSVSVGEVDQICGFVVVLACIALHDRGLPVRRKAHERGLSERRNRVSARRLFAVEREQRKFSVPGCADRKQRTWRDIPQCE